MSHNTNLALAKLKRGELVLGLIIKLASVVQAATVARACDHDFLFVDMQHGGMSIETAITLCHAALDTGVTPLVRVPGHDAVYAPRLLDNGAMGIILPDVETAEQASALVQCCRFPPIGGRSVGAGYPQLGYASVPTPEAVRVMNEQTLLAAMIESGRGIDNVEAIAAVPNIDILHVGSNDLLTEMGIPEQMGRDRHFALCDRVIKACRAHGKFCGVGGVRTLEAQARLVEMGVRMLTTNSDLAFLIAAASERARRLRQIMSPAHA